MPWLVLSSAAVYWGLEAQPGVGGAARGDGEAARGAARVARAPVRGRALGAGVRDEVFLGEDGEERRLLDGDVGLVREDDDRQERVGPEELRPLGEELRVHHVVRAKLVVGEVREVGRVGRARLEVVEADVGLLGEEQRGRVDEEVVPRLVLLLEAAALLPGALHEVGEVGGEGRQVRLAGRLELLVRVPGQEPLALVGRDAACRAARIGAGDQVAEVVVRAVRGARARARVLRGVEAAVGAEAPEARRDDADVDVGHGRERARGAGGAHDRRARRLGRGGEGLVGRGVEARRVEDAVDQVGDGGGEDVLLVGHRRRVVDHQEQVDLVDAALGEDVHLRRARERLERLDGPAEASGGGGRAERDRSDGDEADVSPQGSTLHDVILSSAWFGAARGLLDGVRCSPTMSAAPPRRGLARSERAWGLPPAHFTKS